MKKFFLIPVIAVLILPGCGNNSKNSDNKPSGQNQESNSNTKNSSANVEVVEIKLPTIQCGTCKKNIESAVKKIEGVNNVNVMVKDKKAKVDYDKSKTDLSKIEGTISSAGYQANEMPSDKAAYDKLEDCCKIGGHD